MSQRFSITPAKAAADADISDSVFRTLAVVGIYGDRNGWCWPSQRLLAEIRGVSRQTVSAHIRTLIEKGYINTQPRFDDETGAQKSNMMQLRFDFEFDPPVKLKALHPLSSQELYTPCQTQDFTHNVPINDKQQEEEEALRKVTKLYEQNIGVISQLISEELIDAAKTYPLDWFEPAFKDAMAHNARSWRYIETILKKWQAKGFGYDDRPKKTNKKGKDLHAGIIKATPWTEEQAIRDRELARQLIASETE